MKLKTECITENYRFWKEVNFLAKEAFPPEEYIAPTKLVEMAKEEDFDFFDLTDDGLFVGFAVVKIYKNLAYLFFLAIEHFQRSRGYGSCALETVREKYPNKKQVVDFEMLDEKADNSEQRTKRRDFYLRNGYKEIGLFLSYFGVDYEVFCMNEDFDVEEFKEMMKTIQVEGFDPRYFGKEMLQL